MTKDLSYWSDIWLLNSKGACKYYISISMLGVGGEYEGNAYFAYVVRGSGGSRGKMLTLIMYVRDQNSYSPENGFQICEISLIYMRK